MPCATLSPARVQVLALASTAASPCRLGPPSQLVTPREGALPSPCDDGLTPERAAAAAAAIGLRTAALMSLARSRLTPLTSSAVRAAAALERMSPSPLRGGAAAAAAMAAVAAASPAVSVAAEAHAATPGAAAAPLAAGRREEVEAQGPATAPQLPPPRVYVPSPTFGPARAADLPTPNPAVFGATARGGAAANANPPLGQVRGGASLHPIM
jgi:hypothetical protein